MKVYLLVAYEYDDTEIFGVFATPEAAERRRDKYLKEHAGRPVYMYHQHGAFEIEEHEVQS